MNKGTCNVDGCARPASLRGWCGKHYKRWWRYGDPLAIARCENCGAELQAGGRFCKKNCIAAYRREHYLANKERIAAQQAEYYQRTRGQKIAAASEWAKANPDKKRAHIARYMARADRSCTWPGCQDLGVVGNVYCRRHKNEDQKRRHNRDVAAQRDHLAKRQSGLCPDQSGGGCGLPLDDGQLLHIDHVIPRTLGGPDDDWNLQIMHGPCNDRKHARLVPAAVELAAQHGVQLSALALAV